jgi:hypothetical protein
MFCEDRESKRPCKIPSDVCTNVCCELPASAATVEDLHTSIHTSRAEGKPSSKPAEHIRAGSDSDATSDATSDAKNDAKNDAKKDANMDTGGRISVFEYETKALCSMTSLVVLEIEALGGSGGGVSSSGSGAVSVEYELSLSTKDDLWGSLHEGGAEEVAASMRTTREISPAHLAQQRHPVDSEAEDEGTAGEGAGAGAGAGCEIIRWKLPHPICFKRLRVRWRVVDGVAEEGGEGEGGQECGEEEGEQCKAREAKGVRVTVRKLSFSTHLGGREAWKLRLARDELRQQAAADEDRGEFE